MKEAIFHCRLNERKRIERIWNWHEISETIRANWRWRDQSPESGVITKLWPPDNKMNRKLATLLAGIKFNLQKKKKERGNRLKVGAKEERRLDGRVWRQLHARSLPFIWMWVCVYVTFCAIAIESKFVNEKNALRQDSREKSRTIENVTQNEVTKWSKWSKRRWAAQIVCSDQQTTWLANNQLFGQVYTLSLSLSS